MALLTRVIKKESYRYQALLNRVVEMMCGGEDKVATEDTHRQINFEETEQKNQFSS